MYIPCALPGKFFLAVQKIYCLENRHYLDGEYFKCIVDHLFCHQRRITSHTHYILVVIIIRNAVHIHGVRKKSDFPPRWKRP